MSHILDNYSDTHISRQTDNISVSKLCCTLTYFFITHLSVNVRYIEITYIVYKGVFVSLCNDDKYLNLSLVFPFVDWVQCIVQGTISHWLPKETLHCWFRCGCHQCDIFTLCHQR